MRKIAVVAGLIGLSLTSALAGAMLTGGPEIRENSVREAEKSSEKDMERIRKESPEDLCPEGWIWGSVDGSAEGDHCVGPGLEMELILRQREYGETRML